MIFVAKVCCKWTVSKWGERVLWSDDVTSSGYLIWACSIEGTSYWPRTCLAFTRTYSATPNTGVIRWHADAALQSILETPSQDRRRTSCPSMISRTGVLRRPKICRRRCTRSSSWSLRSWSLLWATWRYWRKTSRRKETGEITTERATFDGTAPLVKSRSALIRGTEELLFTISEEYQNLKTMVSKFGISFAKGWCSASMLKLPL